MSILRIISKMQPTLLLIACILYKCIRKIREFFPNKNILLILNL